MANDDNTFEYDMIAIGSGPGGSAAARQVGKRGGKACIVEAGTVGGVCLNVGCIPTKAMLAGSDLAWRMKNTAPFGIAPAEPDITGPAFMARVSGVVADLSGRSAKAIEMNRQIDLVRGRGRLRDAHTVAVETDDGEKLITARAVVIATGAAPARPGFLPWDSPRLMTTDEAVTSCDLPESVIVMGGGVIGCEMATVYSELGIPTTVVEMMPNLLPGLDPDAAKAVAASLEARGAKIITGQKVLDMTDTGEQLVVNVEEAGELSASVALIAVGRKPNIAGIGLEEAGVCVENGVIAVDDRCRTNIDSVYAIGDAAETQQYAHLADRMGIVAAENIMGQDLVDDRTVVPVGAYTHPEVSSVGLTLAQAKAEHPKARAFRYRYANAGMASASGETDGQLKVIADSETGRVLGALWIGPHAVNMIQEFALAMRHGLSLEQIYHTIHAHPTYQEAAMLAAEGWVGQAMRKRR